MATETLTGRQKAARLLMSLDVATATELLKGVDARIVQDLAVELSYLDAAGYRNTQASAFIAAEFCKGLEKKPKSPFENFLEEMLKGTVGEDRATRIQGQIQDLLKKRDPFMPIRNADLKVLAKVLDSEHPQAVAVILSVFPPKRSSELLGMLGEGIRLSAITRMTSIGGVAPEARMRIAEMVSAKLESALAPKTQAAPGQPTVVAAKEEERQDESFRRVSIILRNLERELRDSVLDAIKGKDRGIVETLITLMVIWEDIPIIGDRSLQGGLRGLDERRLSLALFEADPAIIQKVKANISERAAAMVDEETSLMGKPKKKDVEEAREKILQVLREMNRNGEVTFEEA